MEEKIRFYSGDIELEGLLSRGRGGRGVVITHPHPLYGGDMYNGVVESVAHAYQQKGCATLRFNFRGVGNSQGRHDSGEGEQADVRAALACLREQGITQADLAGYSFGAWVNARIDGETAHIDRMVMVSPPVNFIRFDGIGALPHLGLVVTGDEDEFATPDLIREMLPVWNPGARFEIIPQTDHFYSGALRDLESILGAYLSPPDRS